MHGFLFVEGERPSIETTIELLVDATTQGIVEAETDVLVGIDTRDAGIGVAIASDGAGGVIGAGGIRAAESGGTGDARLLAGPIERVLCCNGSA